MGMYDTVMVPCPKCGTESEFQTKSGPCALGVYKLSEAPVDVLGDINRHGPNACMKCDAVFEVKTVITASVVPVLYGTDAEKDAWEIWKAAVIACLHDDYASFEDIYHIKRTKLRQQFDIWYHSKHL